MTRRMVAAGVLQRRANVAWMVCLSCGLAGLESKPRAEAELLADVHDQLHHGAMTGVAGVVEDIAVRLAGAGAGARAHACTVRHYGPECVSAWNWLDRHFHVAYPHVMPKVGRSLLIEAAQLARAGELFEAWQLSMGQEISGPWEALEAHLLQYPKLRAYPGWAGFYREIDDRLSDGPPEATGAGMAGADGQAGGEDSDTDRGATCWTVEAPDGVVVYRGEDLTLADEIYNGLPTGAHLRPTQDQSRSTGSAIGVLERATPQPAPRAGGEAAW